MRRVLVFTLICLYILSCGEDTTDEDTTPPSPPVLVPKSEETAVSETGIDAVPQWDWIYLEWYPNGEDDLEGYQVWRKAESDTLGDFNAIATLNLAQFTDPQSPDYLDMSPLLAPDPLTGFGRGYYYYLTAHDRSGNISDPSDTTYYMLLNKPQSVSIDAGLDTIRWSYPYTPEGDIYFIIRVTNVSTGQTMWLAQYNEYQEPFAVAYNFNGSASPLTPGEYYLRVDVSYLISQPGKYNGAESNLYNFTVQ